MNKVLDEIQARADAATEGPWAVEVDEDGFDGASVYLNDSGFGTAYICQEVHQGPTEGEADAEFIAHARVDVPKLVAALRAVTKLHSKVSYEEHYNDINGDSQTVTHYHCAVCIGEDTWPVAYPCPTIKVISGVLDG